MNVQLYIRIAALNGMHFAHVRRRVCLEQFVAATKKIDEKDVNRFNVSDLHYQVMEQIKASKMGEELHIRAADLPDGTRWCCEIVPTNLFPTSLLYGSESLSVWGYTGNEMPVVSCEVHKYHDDYTKLYDFWYSAKQEEIVKEHTLIGGESYSECSLMGIGRRRYLVCLFRGHRYSEMRLHDAGRPSWSDAVLIGTGTYSECTYHDP